MERNIQTLLFTSQIIFVVLKELDQAQRLKDEGNS